MLAADMNCPAAAQKWFEEGTRLLEVLNSLHLPHVTRAGECEDAEVRVLARYTGAFRCARRHRVLQAPTSQGWMISVSTLLGIQCACSQGCVQPKSDQKVLGRLTHLLLHWPAGQGLLQSCLEG